MTWCEEPGYVYIDPLRSGVRCMDCRQEIVVTRSFARCRAGERPAGAAGNWRTDYRHCISHKPRAAA